jgi:hypothetical protein
MTVSITTLWLTQTAAQFYALGLELAATFDLPTTSWRTGDPEKSFYYFLSEMLAEKDDTISRWIKAGFLSSAVQNAKDTGDSSWLKLLAYEMYGVSVPDAGYATPTITLVNNGGGRYPKGVGEITVKASSIDKTFRNTDAPAALLPGVTVTYALVADEPGSDSSVSVDELDEIVTTMLGVEIVSSTAGYTNDEMTPDEIGELCRDSLGALSPNGPPDAYEFVCKSAELTGSTEVTRASADYESTVGGVFVYVASASGSVSAASVALCLLAIKKWATPLGFTSSVASATPVTIAVTATVQGDDIPANFASLVAAEVSAYLASVPIYGVVYRSALIAAIHRAVPQIDSVALTVPAADVALGVGEVPVPGVSTITEV